MIKYIFACVSILFLGLQGMRKSQPSQYIPLEFHPLMLPYADCIGNCQFDFELIRKQRKGAPVDVALIMQKYLPKVS